MMQRKKESRREFMPDSFSKPKKWKGKKKPKNMGPYITTLKDQAFTNKGKLLSNRRAYHKMKWVHYINRCGFRNVWGRIYPKICTCQLKKRKGRSKEVSIIFCVGLVSDHISIHCRRKKFEAREFLTKLSTSNCLYIYSSNFTGKKVA